MFIYTPRVSYREAEAFNTVRGHLEKVQSRNLRPNNISFKTPRQFQHGEHNTTKGSSSELLWKNEATTILSISYHMQSSPTTSGYLSQFGFALADPALSSAIAYRLQSDLFQGRGATMLVSWVSGALLGPHLQSTSGMASAPGREATL